MTENNRLEQETHPNRNTTPHSGMTNGVYDLKKKRAEELTTISPIFRKTMSAKLLRPTSEQWRDFSRKLNTKLESNETSTTRTIKDHITSSEIHVARWFWILVALLAIVVIACFIGFSMRPQVMATARAQLNTPPPCMRYPSA